MLEKYSGIHMRLGLGSTKSVDSATSLIAVGPSRVQKCEVDIGQHLRLREESFGDYRGEKRWTDVEILLGRG